MSHTNSEKNVSYFSLLGVCGALWGLVAGLLAAMAFLVLNPAFIDSFAQFLLWLVVIPMALGALAGLFLGLLTRLLASGKDNGLPALSSVGLAMMIIVVLLVPAIPLGLGLGLFGSSFVSFLVVSAVLLAVGLFCAWMVLFRGRGTTPVRRILQTSRNIALVAVLLFAVIWPVSALFRAPPQNLAGDSPDILIIGLDGASPVVLEDMVSKGQLPTFASIMDQGCYGELTSLTPIFSPMIWTSIVTGKMPEKHGVRDFLNASYLDIKAKTVWEIFEESGGKTGLYEWLCTWPPAKINGFVVPGWLARNSLTYPTSLQFIKEIKTAGKTGAETTSRIGLGRAVIQSVKHGVKLSSLANLGKLYVYNGLASPTRAEIHFKKYLMAMSMDADIFEYLLATEKPKYAFYYHQTIDPISHVYWQYHNPTGFSDLTDEEVKRFGEVVGGAYEAMDSSLGRLLDRLGPETRVMIISDHGFQSIFEGPEHSGLLVSIRADALLDCLGIVDLEGFHTMSQLFMTAQTEDEGRANQILMEALDALGTFWVPELDVPLFIPEFMDNPGSKADYVRISLNPQLRDHFLAGRISQEKTNIRYQGGECLLGNLVWRKFSSGVHHPEGILLARGPGIRSGVRLQRGESSVIDVTPTLLAMAGIPLAHDMDGKVLFDIFEAGTVEPDSLSWVESYGNGEVKKPIIGQTDQGDDDGLRDQLQQLGYIDG